MELLGLVGKISILQGNLT